MRQVSHHAGTKYQRKTRHGIEHVETLEQGHDPKQQKQRFQKPIMRHRQQVQQMPVCHLGVGSGHERLHNGKQRADREHGNDQPQELVAHQRTAPAGIARLHGTGKQRKQGHAHGSQSVDQGAQRAVADLQSTGRVIAHYVVEHQQQTGKTPQRLNIALLHWSARW